MMDLDRVEVLMVEDNPTDILLTREAFRNVGTPVTIHSVGDGDQALAYLHQQGPFAGQATPNMILLDLNLPRMDGWEVLERVKGDPDLEHIPVLVFTSSSAPSDILAAYRKRANSYVTKPMNLAGFTRLVHAIHAFWFSAVQLPDRAA